MSKKGIYEIITQGEQDYEGIRNLYRKLILLTLKDICEYYRKKPSLNSRREEDKLLRKNFLEAMNWVEGKMSEPELISFEQACRVSELDPDKAREKILNLERKIQEDEGAIPKIRIS